MRVKSLHKACLKVVKLLGLFRDLSLRISKNILLQLRVVKSIRIAFAVHPLSSSIKQGLKKQMAMENKVN